jgi:hypothetical protein
MNIKYFSTFFKAQNQWFSCLKEIWNNEKTLFKHIASHEVKLYFLKNGLMHFEHICIDTLKNLVCNA